MGKVVQRSLLVLMAVVVSVSFVVSGAGQVLAKAVDPAAPSTGVSIGEKVKSYLMYTAVGKCIQQNKYEGGFSSDYIEPQLVSSGDWFLAAGGVKTNASYLTGLDQADTECGNASFVNAALSAWAGTYGQTLSPIETLCTLGFHRANNSDCVNGTDNLVPASDPVAAYKAGAAKLLMQTTLTDPMRYVIFSQSLMNGCQAKSVVAYAQATPDQKNIAGSKKGYRMTVVDDSTTPPGAPVDTIFSSERDNTDSIEYDTTPSFTINSDTCANLAAAASKYAGAYQATADGSMSAISKATASATSSPNEETCAVEGVGWIVCPVLTFLGKLTDGAYTIIESLLVFHLQNPFDTNSSTYIIWSNIRNLANLVFIFVFFAIVFSQSTGWGIGNYGIKKLLPRILVGAILVNVSYYLCIFALDVSNILGAGIDGMVKSTLNGTGTLSTNGSKGTWANTVAAIIGGGAVVGYAAYVGFTYALTSLLSVILPTTLLAITIVIVAIIGYKVLWVVLIVISPLIAVASILPGTQSFYHKGLDLAKGLIVFYPIVAFAFSISVVAGAILRSAAH